ncbi:hypothetical protein, partial [uncultured Alistipes sp.]|uniref:hypothetical protein n=1 Tax=uncultured Alistipes sp. TaxID=538949 RepID=UPI0026E0BC07
PVILGSNPGSSTNRSSSGERFLFCLRGLLPFTRTTPPPRTVAPWAVHTILAPPIHTIGQKEYEKTANLNFLTPVCSKYTLIYYIEKQTIKKQPL